MLLQEGQRFFSAPIMTLRRKFFNIHQIQRQVGFHLLISGHSQGNSPFLYIR